MFFKGYPFALRMYVSNYFQSGKKRVMFSCLSIKITVFSLNLVVSNESLMALQGF